MNPSAELDLIVYGATGFTGRLIAEYLVQTHGKLAWAMAGRSAEKLAGVRDELGALRLDPVRARRLLCAGAGAKEIRA
jgi:short subunit dehydrogenase-like uncharacterized protein